MEMQIGKMVLNGIVYALLYIALPLTVLYLLDFYNIITFSSYFIVGIIIFGIIGVIMAVLKAAYPKDSAKNRVIMFIITIYSGVYVFYIFGGFDPTTELGNFSINTQLVQVLLGIKLIAWLSLASAAVKSLQYLFEAFELRGVTKDSREYKRRAKPSLFFKIISILISIGLALYIISLIWSGVNIRPAFLSSPTFNYDDGGTPVDPSDDILNLTTPIDFINQGLYPLNEFSLKMELWVISSNSTIPSNTKIGESSPIYYPILPAQTITSMNIELIVGSTYASDLANSSGTMDFKMIFSTFFGGIFVNINFSLVQPYNLS